MRSLRRVARAAFRLRPFGTSATAVLVGLTLASAQRTSDVRVGPITNRKFLVSTGQILTPAGISIRFPRRPVDIVVTEDQRSVYVKDSQGITRINGADWTIDRRLGFPAGGGSMHGLAASKDGARVYVTDALRGLHIAQVDARGRARWAATIDLPGRRANASYPCGIALSADGARAYVCLSMNNTLAEVDLIAGKLVREIPVGVAPYDVVLAPNAAGAWVSNFGGRHPGRGVPSADSAGTPTRIDYRGVASSGTVSNVNLRTGVVTAELAVGLHPSDLALDPRGTALYVANANSDSISIINTARRTVIKTFSVRPTEDTLFGYAPTGLCLSPDGRRLYASLGGANAIAVFGIDGKVRSNPRLLGYLQAGWYPSAVAIAGPNLLIANTKGSGRRIKTLAGGFNVKPTFGSLQILVEPSEYTNHARPDHFLSGPSPTAVQSTDALPVAVPTTLGRPSHFKHVVYVIKENRTYDQVFGDITAGDGDPKLCIYGRDITPNQHALAEQFVLLDNFYCNGVLSADGHSWVTEGYVTDHLEKSFGGFTRSYTFGDDPLTYSSKGFIWDNALDHGKTVANFGELVYTETVPKDASFTAIYSEYRSGKSSVRFNHKTGIARLRRFTHPTYPGWNMRVPDVMRADIYLKSLKTYAKIGKMPNLTLLYLPNDHTSGTAPGAPTPRAQVADNDLALGRIIEGISRSRFWKETCIFVIEDDPQDGFDHVDGHRSTCLVISPYSRLKSVVSNFYNQTSVLHTIESILGLPPMTRMDANSPTMEACFTNRPDRTTFKSLMNRVPLDEMNPPISALSGTALNLAMMSSRLPLARPDRADEETLNRILWHSARGAAAFPASVSGAHGTGLRARGLRNLDKSAPDDD